MAIEVVIQDERCNQLGSVVHDLQGVIVECLPDPSDHTFSCVRFVDPYGDTIFNPLQAAVMLQEWDRLKAAFSERDAETLWADVRKLIVSCSEEPHHYLRFVGD